MLRMSLLSSEDSLALFRIARLAISTAVTESRLPEFPPVPDTLRVSRGAFVTLFRNGKLRGCVGQVENPPPLAEGVARAAINAALHDPRFRPLAVEEIVDLGIEISVLSPLEPIAPREILTGRHGLLVLRPPKRGLLLPQVATKRGWSGQQLLEETCAKAGLSRDDWRDPLTQVFAFTAEVLSEAEFRAAPGE